jgi:hypothetical protein
MLTYHTVTDSAAGLFGVSRQKSQRKMTSLHGARVVAIWHPSETNRVDVESINEDFQSFGMLRRVGWVILRKFPRTVYNYLRIDPAL